MKKLLKGLLVLLLIVFVGSKGIEWYVEHKFESLINKNPERAYNINYTSFNLHTFFTGITLDEVSIVPFNKPTGTIINGQVDYAELSGFKWWRFIFSKSVSLDVLSFEQPQFNINITKSSSKITDSTQKTSKNKMQNLFSDLLSRVDLNDFQIVKGSVKILQDDSILIGEVDRVDIRATNIATDSIMFKHIIPFKLGNLQVQLDSAFYQINDYTKAQLGSLDYDISKETFSIKGFSLDYDKDWVAISQERGIQDDVMEFSLDSLLIKDLKFSSSFWSDLDIEAAKMNINGLMLSMKRNKNLPRPPDVQKPLFQGMINKIPIKIDIDSIFVNDSKVMYGELSVNRKNTGVIEITNVNGVITQLTTFPSRKNDIKFLKSKFKATLNDEGHMNIVLKVPYSEDAFSLHTSIRSMDMTALSKSTLPLLGVEILKGQITNLDYHMEASLYGSRNSLIMDYENLYISIFKENDDGSQHKKGFISSIANTAIRHNNMPKDKGYQTASYRTERNIYRSPFQHIVAGVLDGAKRIIPGKGIQSLITKNDSAEKKEKQEKKTKKKTRP